jgi:uncharacterized membrane protein YvlD (DUF360 family)
MDKVVLSRRGLQPRAGDLARMLLAWAVSSMALVGAAAVLPGLSADRPGWFVVVAAVTAAFGAIVRPVLVGVAAVIGWWAVALLAICGQAIVMHLALLVVPGIVSSSFWVDVAATWIAAALSTLLTWLTTTGTDEAFVASVRRSRHRATVSDPQVDGVLFVQLDGVSYPVASWALQSGSMPVGLGGDAPAARMDRPAALHHAGEPIGDPARDLRRRPGVSVVRQGARAGRRREPSR